MVYIFCSTEKHLRDKHYKELINLYYSEFSGLLKILGVDAETFPRSALDDQLVKVGRYGLALSLFAIDALTKVEIPDLNDMAEQLKVNATDKSKEETTNEKFNEWMSGTIRDAVKYGILQ